MIKLFWQFLEAFEMDHCARCNSLEANLEAANRTITEQHNTITSQAADLVKANEAMVDAKYQAGLWLAELKALKYGINTTHAQE